MAVKPSVMGFPCRKVAQVRRKKLEGCGIVPGAFQG